MTSRVLHCPAQSETKTSNKTKTQSGVELRLSPENCTFRFVLICPEFCMFRVVQLKGLAGQRAVVLL